MNVKKLLLVVGALVLAVVLFFAGTSFAQSGQGNDERGWSDMMDGWGYGRMHDWTNRSDAQSGESDGDQDWSGMMDGWGYGRMHEWGNGAQDSSGFPGHMDGWEHPRTMHGVYGDMMGNWGSQNSGADVEPLSLEETEAALDDYLAERDEEGLTVGEIMIFDNHAYAQIVDAGGNGAFELLVDPVTGRAYPEPGPNMMWNTEYGHPAGGYGHHAGGAGMMGMMAGWSQPEGEPQVTAQEAVALAQAYLDEALPGATAEEHADAFPGYYTLHVLRDGQVEGMLSVNAYDGDVFPHTWHGQFVEMTEEHAG